MTREPSCRRASTIGLDSSMRRPTDADDALDDCDKGARRSGRRRRSLPAALALDVDLVVAIDENVRDVGIAQQRLERTEAEDLVQNVGDERSRSNRLSGVVWLSRSSRPTIRSLISGSASSRLTASAVRG